MHAFFCEGRKRDERTNGQTHIGGWVKNVTNRRTHGEKIVTDLRKQLSVRPSMCPHFYFAFVRSSHFRPIRLCVFVRLSVRHVFDPRQKKHA